MDINDEVGQGVETTHRVTVEAVIKRGMSAARHLRGDIYEVRAIGKAGSYRILFALEGRFSHIFLGIHAFPKKTQKTPNADIELAEDRLADWRARLKRDHPG